MPTLMIVQVELGKQARLIKSGSVALNTTPTRDLSLGVETPASSSSTQPDINDSANQA
jgi:hypothetical protein